MYVLVIDNYDSFTYNLVQAIGSMGHRLEVFRNDKIAPAEIAARKPDRLLVSPAPRSVLLAGTVLSASARALIPATFVLTIAFALGASWPGAGGLAVTYLMVMLMAAVAACWGSALALRFKSQSAAPLMLRR